MAFTTTEPHGSPWWYEKKGKKFVYSDFYSRTSALPRFRGKKNIIISLSIGESDFGHITAESRARYAARLKCEIYEMRHYTGMVGPVVHWEKLRIKRWLDEGYRVLFLDNDTLVLPSCPDLFRLIPAEYFAAMDETETFDLTDGVGARWVTYKMAEYLGYKGPESAYCGVDKPHFNAGVFLAGPQHAKLFETPVDPGRELWNMPLTDQAYLNHMLVKNRTAVLRMDREFNCFRPRPGEVPWILHAVGVPMEKRLKYFAGWI